MAAHVEKTTTQTETLGILPLQDAVLFPNTVIPLAVVKKPGIVLVEEALREGRQIGLVALKDKDTENPGPAGRRPQRRHRRASIQKMLKVPDGTLRCIVAGSSVFKIDRFTQSEPYPRGRRPRDARRLGRLRTVGRDAPESREPVPEVVGLSASGAPREMEMEVNNITDSNLLTYFIASTMRLETSDRQAILEERNTEKRMRKLTILLTKELEVVELGHKIQSDIQREMEKNQREFYLRQQLRAIQEELGETDPQLAETSELRKKIEEAQMPEEVRKAADRAARPAVEKPQSVARSTASSAPTSIGSCSCRGARRRATRSISKRRGRSSTRTTTTSIRSRTGSSSTSPSAN